MKSDGGARGQGRWITWLTDQILASEPRRVLVVIGMVVLGFAFITDAATPRGYTLGAWYSVAIFLTAASLSGRLVVATGSVALALTVVAGVVSPPAPAEYTVLLTVASRVSMIVIIILTTSIAVAVLKLMDRVRGQIVESRTLVETAADMCGVGGWWLDTNTRSVTWSTGVDQILETATGVAHHPGEVLGMLAPQHRKRLAGAVDAAIRIGTSFDETFEMTTSAGRRIWLRAIGTPECDTAGRTIALRGAVQDQTEQQLTLAARTETETMTRMASGLARMGGWQVDVPSFVLHWSDMVRQIHEVPDGYVPVIDAAMDFYAPEHREEIQRLFGACVDNGIPFDTELVIVTYTGRRIWVRAIGEALIDPAGKIFAVQGAFQDIDMRKALESRKQELEERLQLTLESMTDAFFLLDSEWRFEYLNPKAEQILMRSSADLVGKTVWEEFPDSVGSDFEMTYRRVAATGLSETFESPYPPLGIIVEVSAYSVPDGVAVHFRDISLQRSLEEQLRQSQRLEALGQLTGGVAHDFNNLLTVVMGNGELLVEALTDRPELGELADMSLRAAERGAELTQSLLAFARRQPLVPQPVDVNELVTRIRPLLQRTIGEHIELRFVRSDGPRVALIDPAQLEGALLNLTLNARDAMGGGGRLTIESSYVSLDTDYAEQNSEAVAGQYVLIALSDSGTGIDPEQLPHVFDPFFTTKAKGEGTGLGLSMVYGFVKQSSGHVKIYSEPGHGTTVRLYLPLAKEPVGEPEEIADVPVHGVETILVVEDDEGVRRYVERALSRLNYRVVTAGNGPEALEVLRARDDIDLLFTDVVMPGGMTGRELADSALLERPGLPVLFTSGYTDGTIVHHGRLDPGSSLLSKPYKVADLAKALRQALDCELI